MADSPALLCASVPPVVPDAGVRSLGRQLRDVPAWLLSAILHLTLLALLMIVYLPLEQMPSALSLNATLYDSAEEDLAPIDLGPPIETAPGVAEVDWMVGPSLSAQNVNLPQVPIRPPGVSVRPGNVDGPNGASIPAAYGGRLGPARTRLALSEGGSPESEAAVELALDWLVRHQFPDGSWSFYHGDAPGCKDLCADNGAKPFRNGATGMALMCFLGAGYTQHDGPQPHRRAVEKGLYYLISRIRLSDRTGGDLRGSKGDGMAGMYCQGLATIAMTEACGMTADEALRPAAQAAVDFIVYRQSPRTGGWRYSRLTGGDTSVTGFQLMALRSAQLAGLRVPGETIDRARDFLDRVQSEHGSRYGYIQPGRHGLTGRYGGCAGLPSTSAVGLLCRMYTGWTRYHDGIRRGILYLDNVGPSQKDMYYNYYATMVMRQYGDRPWKRWNAAMRDRIVGLQDHDGHEAGSWAPFGAWGHTGGRLMDTAFCCMTLEVYYRYMPLYGRSAVGGAFTTR